MHVYNLYIHSKGSNDKFCNLVTALLVPPCERLTPLNLTAVLRSASSNSSRCKDHLFLEVKLWYFTRWSYYLSFTVRTIKLSILAHWNRVYTMREQTRFQFKWTKNACRD